MYFVVQTGVYIARRTSIIGFTMGIGAAINIALNFALIPPLGIVGAALATGLGHLAALISLYTLAQRVLPIPYQRTKLIAVVLVAGGMIALAPLVNTGFILKDLLLKAGVLALYGAAVLATRAITLNDLAILWKMNWRIDDQR